jgi:hypothetical protein
VIGDLILAAVVNFILILVFFKLGMYKLTRIFILIKKNLKQIIYVDKKFFFFFCLLPFLELKESKANKRRNKQVLDGPKGSCENEKHTCFSYDGPQALLVWKHLT